jgi:hypothetical protein
VYSIPVAVMFHVFRPGYSDGAATNLAEAMAMTSASLHHHRLLLCGLVVGACSGSSTVAPGQPIRFDRPEIGQRSRYSVLIGHDYFSASPSPFEYVDGVLVAEIVDHDASGFRVREAFAAPSEVDPRVRDMLDSTGVYEYYLGVQDNTLRVLPTDGELRSRLFPASRAAPQLPLADVTDPVVAIFGWKTTLPNQGDYLEAAIRDGEILGATYPHLNVVIDNTAVPVDGPGTTWLYDATHGVVRSTHYSWWTQNGTGFDLMPD